jgi:hypothetical protein
MNLIILWRGGAEVSFHLYKLMWYFELYSTQNNTY